MKFRVKIALSMICLLSLLFGIGGSVLISLSFQVMLDREKDNALNSYQNLLNTLSYVSQIDIWTDSSDISDTLKQLYTQSSFAPSALKLSSEGTSVYETGTAIEYLENTPTDNLGGECILSIFDAEDKQYLQISSSFIAGGKTLNLDSVYDISSIYEMRSQQQKIYYRVFVVLVVLCAVFAYSISRLLTRPLSSLSKASREIAKGNLGFRSKIQTNDEIGSLSTDFDVMADQVQDSIEIIQTSMARQEQFMSNFSHELKNPMTSILGYAELIRDQALTEDEQVQAAGYIFSEGKRLESLSLKLLEIFMTDGVSIEFSLSSPASLVSEIVANLRPTYAELNINLMCKCENGTCLLEPDLVKSLLINLIDNARKAMDHGGTILITSQMTSDGCLITIKDDGKGIPAQSLTHLTEAFYRVDKSRSRELGGAGLGLTFCSKIVDLHNGVMKFESQEGKGTCVTVSLRGGAS